MKENFPSNAERIREHTLTFGIPWRASYVIPLTEETVLHVFGMQGWMFTLRGRDFDAVRNELEAIYENSKGCSGVRLPTLRAGNGCADVV